MDGEVQWSPQKSLWFLFHSLMTVIVAPLCFSWCAFVVFVCLTVIVLCLGHSIGMHRLLIHRSFECPLWLELILVYFGVLVGMAGPIGMIYQHDLRDWAQRQRVCHSFLKHGSHLIKDGWWQLNCDLKLHQAPNFHLEKRVAESAFYSFLEKTWMLQNLWIALLLFVLGGFDFVVWGVSVRIVVSVGGHWLVGYFAHNHGHKSWEVKGAAVQGHNIKVAGLLSMGEAWHNNHHAFPGSARLGLKPNQPDPGWWVISILKKWGLVSNIKLPEDLPFRPELKPIKDTIIG
jgi:fatty-acid desaturase